MRLDILCFCHLRWNFVYQRPQHLLSRFATNARVFVFEEPVFENGNHYLEINKVEQKQVWVITPHIKPGMEENEITFSLKKLTDQLLESFSISNFISWYYSPMALDFSNHLKPEIIVYDCMDELSAFNGAPPQLIKNEKALFKKADLVFTGGHHLYEAKKSAHHNIYPFPSSIDKEHFLQARNHADDPADQKLIPHPRIGFYGVLDERMNIQLVGELAAMQPSWHFIFLGPVVKIDPATLPAANNIHYLGSKSYNELPQYLGGWDVAMMPFALNKSTEFISPTKTPEFLAGGKKVVSTSIKDVVTPYGVQNLVHIADTSGEFETAINKILNEKDNIGWLRKTDMFLAGISWDKTWRQMQLLMEQTLKTKKNLIKKQKEIYV